MLVAVPLVTPVTTPLFVYAAPISELHASLIAHVPTSAVSHAVPFATNEKHGLVSAGYLNFINGVAHTGLGEGHFSGIAYGGPKSISSLITFRL